MIHGQMTTKTTNSPMPIPIARAVGTLELGKSFLDAAIRVQNAERFSLVGHFLVGHAIELALKAAITSVGTTEEHLRNKIGHDLGRALRAADMVSESLSELDRQNIAVLDAVYRAKALEYVEPGYMSLPALPGLIELTERIVRLVEPEVRLRVLHSLSSEDSHSPAEEGPP